MAGIDDLPTLLRSMQPQLHPQRWVFCTLPDGTMADATPLQTVAMFHEAEGLTLVLEESAAQAAQLDYDGTFAQITLTVHSSLEAVGLTAAVATRLAEHGISANVIAAYYHDHIFVQSHKAEAAMTALATFSAD